MRRSFVLLLLVPMACAPPPALPPSPPSHAPVLVTIVIDQLAAWLATERWPELPTTGGFARLRREGVWLGAMRYDHAVTDTAPGHSSLYTGAFPRVSGIFANEVLDADGNLISILRDPATRLVTSDGPSSLPSSSLGVLRVETLADRLRAEHPDALIVGLSLKDRGAMFGAGRSPDAALWFDTQQNRFVTSAALAGGFPRWAGRAAADVARAEASTWEPLDPAWIGGHAASPDAEAGEGDPGGMGTVFPHRLGVATNPALAFRTSPFADEVLVGLALSALDASWNRARTTLVALSLSPNDYIGHTFGPDSWEAWDEMLRLDALLGRFFAELDARFGREGYAVMLTGDHGISSMPEVGRASRCDSGKADPWDRGCGPGARILGEDVSASLAAKAREVAGPGRWVLGVADPYVYLTAAAHALDAAAAARLTGALVTSLEADPHVARVFVVRDIPATCPTSSDESIDALVCRSVARGAGDLYVVLRHGSFFDGHVVVGKGTNHGSPYVYDRTVPLLVVAPGVIAPGGVLRGPLPFTTFVRTAAAILGISPPHDAGPGPSLTAPR